MHCAWRRVETEEAFGEVLCQSPPDVILSDYTLPGFDGSAALALALREAPDTPFIFGCGMALPHALAKDCPGSC
jgi:two-component system, NarL family, sensor histidine kinase UhpB